MSGLNEIDEALKQSRLMCNSSADWVAYYNTDALVRAVLLANIELAHLGETLDKLTHPLQEIQSYKTFDPDDEGEPKW